MAIAACLGWVQQCTWCAGGQIAGAPAWFEQIRALSNSRVIVHVAAVQAGLLEETWFRLYAIHL